MIESVIVRAIRDLNPTLTHIVGGQNGYHPNTVFIIVEEFDSYLVGTPTRELSSRTGKWLQQQTKEYVVRIGVQGKKNESPQEIAEMLQLRMDTPKVRQLVFDEGYSMVIDKQLTPLTMVINTDQYPRYSFSVKLRTSISFEIEQDTILGVGVEGTFVQKHGGVIEEYEEVIPKGSST